MLLLQSGSDKEKEAELHREIKELLKEASSLAQYVTHALAIFSSMKRNGSYIEFQLLMIRIIFVLPYFSLNYYLQGWAYILYKHGS